MQDLRAGFHRRIELHPSPGRIVATLEDNLDRFDLALSHDGGVVSEVEIRAERYPWTTCAAAPAFLREQALGRRLEELASLNGLSHCTHLFELAILCAAHAYDADPVSFDLHVDAWEDSRTRVQLLTGGVLVLALDILGRTVTTPGDWFGRDLLGAGDWRLGLDAVEREQAMLVSRAIYVSLGCVAPVVARAAERGARALGVCFTYQPSRVGDAVRAGHQVDA